MNQVHHPDLQVQGPRLPSAAVAQSDAALIEQSWNEPEQFGLLFDRHFGPVHRFIGRRIGSDRRSVDIADLAGETFTIAFERRRAYDLQRDDALPWLYGIARNLIRTGRRKSVRGIVATAAWGRQELWSGLPDIADEVASAVDARIDLEAVADVLRHAKSEAVEALLLQVWEGLSYDEIALTLGVPSGTVRSRISRLRDELERVTSGPGRHRFDAARRTATGEVDP